MLSCLDSGSPSSNPIHRVLFSDPAQHPSASARRPQAPVEIFHIFKFPFDRLINISGRTSVHRATAAASRMRRGAMSSEQPGAEHGRQAVSARRAGRRRFQVRTQGANVSLSRLAPAHARTSRPRTALSRSPCHKHSRYCKLVSKDRNGPLTSSGTVWRYLRQIPPT